MSTTKVIPFVAILVAVLTVLPAALAQTPETPAAEPQPIAEPAVYVGEVTGNDVYVRSGPSTNYYPVIKLKAGARVQVVGRENTWLAIEPPEGSFSLISDTYVDTTDGGLGVVNGDNIRVRAGSMLNDKMYAVQGQLSKGAEVEILGHNDNGYYRIAPPPGAKLWIAEQYVARVPEELLTLEGQGQAQAQGRPQPPGVLEVEKAPQSAPPGAATAERSPALNVEKPAELTASSTPLPPGQPVKLDGRLDKLDAELKAELAKPLLRRDLERFRAAFAALAEQSTDEFTQLYAKARVDQIADMVEMIEVVRGVQDLRDQVTTTRTDALTARAGIRPPPPPIEGGFHIEGELRPSAAFVDPSGPRRYRLVAPGKSPIRTLGYVEIPPDSPIDADEFLGRLVGIRAREVRLETGGVDPISIFIPEEIIVLDAGGE